MYVNNQWSTRLHLMSFDQIPKYNLIYLQILLSHLFNSNKFTLQTQRLFTLNIVRGCGLNS